MKLLDHVRDVIRRRHYLIRLMECVRLRVKDIYFEQNHVIVREGKGMKDRSTMLPEQLIELLRGDLRQVKLFHDQDFQEGFGEVDLPFTLERKYPNAGKQCDWQYCPGIVLPTNPLVLSPAKRGIEACPRRGGAMLLT
jgi:integrase